MAELNLRLLGVGGSVGDGFEGAEFFHTDFGGSAGVIHFAGAYAFEIEFASGRMAVHMSGATQGTRDVGGVKVECIDAPGAHNMAFERGGGSLHIDKTLAGGFVECGCGGV